MHNTQPDAAVTGAIHGCISGCRYVKRKYRRVRKVQSEDEPIAEKNGIACRVCESLDESLGHTFYSDPLVILMQCVMRWTLQ